MHQLLYVSGAKPGIGKTDIAEILATARANNARIGVTGVLLHADDTFLQILEGAKADVRNLYQRIALDRRHRNVMLLMEHDASERAFGSWSMGFQSLDIRLGQDRDIFRITRSALESRIKLEQAEILMTMVRAFCRVEETA